MKVKWVKIVVDIFDDEKIKLIETLPEGDTILVIWMKLLCLAGKCNRNGFLLATDTLPYDEMMLSTVLGRPYNIVRLALETFLQFGMVEPTSCNALHVFCIKNFASIQDLNRIKQMQENTKKRVQAFRTRQLELLPCNASNADVTLQNKNKNIIYTSKFEEFWRLYPRKVGKGHALKAWVKVIPDLETFTQVMAALETQRDSNYFPEDPKYIPHPATWLNGQRWLDELPRQQAEEYIR